MNKKIRLSVALATFNEENNIGDCLESVRQIADEIVIVDGTSIDKTVEVAKRFNAKVLIVPNQPNFHINKQKSFDNSSGEWILYLDADERVGNELANEIKKVMLMGDAKIEKYQNEFKNRQLFLRHQKLLEKRDGPIGNSFGEYVAFFVPRSNYFLGKYLKYGGVYPDGVIRLFKNGKAYLPCKSVHEQMVVEGKVGWLQNDLLHLADPTFQRYLQRNDRYINLMVEDMKKNNLDKNLKNFLNFCLIKPIWWFLLTSVRHKGFLDGLPGIIFFFFSALRFPRAYLCYLSSRN